MKTYRLLASYRGGPYEEVMPYLTKAEALHLKWELERDAVMMDRLQTEIEEEPEDVD